MTIKREKQRHGIIVQEALTSDALEGDDVAALEAEWDIVDPGAAAMLGGYIASAEAVIASTSKLSKGGKRMARWMAARQTKIHAAEAIKYLAAGDAEQATWNALVAARAAWIMDVKSVEPQVVTGSKVRRPFENQNNEASTIAADRYAEWQRLANVEWTKRQHVNKSASDIARLIAAPGENPNTIRRHIKKLS
jgi:hypothetical protein